MGKQVIQRLFRSANGTLLNADVNAADNILRKAVPKAFDVDGIEDVGFHPENLLCFFKGNCLEFSQFS